jgi:AraC-like DNA-binding protein
MVPLENPARPLDPFPLIRTTSAEQIKASIERAYAKPQMKFIGHRDAFRATINHCQLKHVGLAYGEFGADILWGFPPKNFAAHVFPIRGKAEIVTRSGSVVVNDRQGAVISSGSSFQMRNDADYRRLMLTIDAGALASTLAALTGEDVRSPPRFAHKPDSRSQAARWLQANFEFLVRQMSAPTPPSPFIVSEFEQTLIVAFLRANRHDYSHLLEEEPTEVGAPHVRRAEDYIEASWSAPFSLVALAAEARAGVRGLVKSFRKMRGCSPFDFLQQVRLRRARRLLANPECDVGLAEVARTCGFADVARFRREYAELFGEHPSTARRHKR